MNRTKYPKDRKTRQALKYILQVKGHKFAYITLLLGYSVYCLDSHDRHFLFEHPGMVPELVQLLNDEAFRKKKVDEYLELYKVEIAKVTDSNVG